jgi:transcriptional regulator with XRE-family HTH domain
MNMDKKSLPTIAKNIRKIRNKKGISQDMLSKLANISFNTVTKIEAGDTPNPTIETVKKIAGALDVSIDSLMK